MDGYRFLMQNYHAGDKICLFGMLVARLTLYVLTNISSSNRLFERRLYCKVCHDEIHVCKLIFVKEPLADSYTRLFLSVCLCKISSIYAPRLVCSCEATSNKFHLPTNFINGRIPRVWHYAPDSRKRIAWTSR